MITSNAKVPDANAKLAMRKLRAEAQNPHTKRMNELRRAAEENRHRISETKRKETELFSRWLKTDLFLARLEEERDAFAPRTPDEDWNDVFANAVLRIPDVRREAMDLWYEYVGIRGG